jgi:hypothetical protein
MSRLRLSSNMTAMFKIVLPLLWIGGFSFGATVMFVQGHAEALTFLVLTLLGTAVLLPLALKLKRVEVDRSHVYIAGVVNEIAIPLSDIVSVHQKILINIRPVFIVFREKTRFGKSIMFMPPASFRLFSKDPVVEELRRLAGFSGEWRPDA